MWQSIRQARSVLLGLAIGALLLITDASYELWTSSEVTRAEDTLTDANRLRYELAILLAGLDEVLDQHDAPVEVRRVAARRAEEHLKNLAALTAADPAQHEDFRTIRILVRIAFARLTTETASEEKIGHDFEEQLRAVAVRLDARASDSLVAAEAQLQRSRKIDRAATLVSLLIGLFFIGITGVVVFRRVLADRRAAVVRSEKELLDALVHLMPIGVSVVDAERRVLLSNPAFRAVWPANELAEPLANAALDVIEVGVPSTTQDAADGKSVTWSCHRVHLPSRDDDCVLFTVVDTTESRRAQEALSQSEEYLRILIDSAPAALALFDRQMRYLGASAGWRRAYKLGDRPLIGECHYDVFPQLTERKAIHERALAGEVVAHPGELLEIDGAVQWVRWETRPWHDRTGAIGGIVIFAEDVTEQFILEAARNRALDQLRHQDRVVTVGTLAASFAHEIGTPLSVVMGHAKMIARREVSAAELTTSAEAILAQAERVTRIVRDLLDFARRARSPARLTATDSTPPSPERADVLESVDRTLSLVSGIAQKAGVELRKNAVDTSPAHARISQQALSQVLMNLVMNGIQACGPRGEVSVTIERLRDAEEAAIQIAVSDTGMGMSADVVERIFEPFFTTKAPGEGTGLGLAIVNGIVHDCGGVIEVKTERERGTTFRVVLPALRPKSCE